MFEKQINQEKYTAGRRVFQYEAVDGLFELAMGCALLLMAVALLLSTIFTDIFPPLIFLPVFLGIPHIFSGVSVLKRRLTYPRTGYAIPRYPRYLTPVIFFGLFIVFSFLTFLPLFLPHLQLLTDQVFLLLIGVLLTAMLLWLGAGLTRFYVLAVISLLLSVTLVWLQLEPAVEYLIYCIILGLSMLTSGTLTLRRYLRKNS